MLTVAIYIQDAYTSQYNRVDLFDDEKISVVSSISNVNDISKTYSDFSQTFTIPASKQNNKIFRHWYDNSNDVPFSVLIKSNAYIEIDTMLFRKGKIQLENVSIVDGNVRHYSITFIGLLGNLKDTFGGKFLKDLTSATYDIPYTANEVLSRVVDNTASRDVMFPLISSNRVWNYGGNNVNDISKNTSPILYNELYPALRVRAVLNMIQSQFGISFNGTSTDPSTFLTTDRLLNAYLYMKNSESFSSNMAFVQVIINGGSGAASAEAGYKYGYPYQDNYVRNVDCNATYTSYYPVYTYLFQNKKLTFTITTATNGGSYIVKIYKNDQILYESPTQTSTVGGTFSYEIENTTNRLGTGDKFNVFIGSFNSISFTTKLTGSALYKWTAQYNSNVLYETRSYIVTGSTQTTLPFTLQMKSFFPEIKIEDFFSGLLKMFNLVCYSDDGVIFTIDTLESYYLNGSDLDITQYVLQDKKDIDRVKTYKKINFEYEKSQSYVNVAFNSVNGIEYGSLQYQSDPPSDGSEFSIKLPFENLNFQKLASNLQVGYALKTDYKSYIPKPIILYDYKKSGTLSTSTFYTSDGSSATARTTCKAFGQESLIDTGVYTLNFPDQQSTLTNEIIDNTLYHQYYEGHFSNIFNYKARLVKLTALLPTSILTTLKLNDAIIVNDAKYVINTMTTDLTNGEVNFELLTYAVTETIPYTPPPPPLVTIGTQIWYVENFDGTEYNNGDIIPQHVGNALDWANLTIGAWTYPNGSSGNNDEYGKLYNWLAITDSRGIAPAGYRVPTKDDFDTLRLFLDPNGGDKLKEIGDVHWTTGTNLTATNSSGFTARGAGKIDYDGVYRNFKSQSYFHSSTVNPSLSTQNFCILLYDIYSTISYGYTPKKNGYSVRFIKE